ncbi:MAG: hypothetical protein IPN71_14785 [Fibrobacteres bacterium]|nr:hypothetical protein [Fibrobacterota bacterium]
MSLIYDPTLKANLLLDDNSRIRALRQVDEYREIEGQFGHGAAATYVREVAGKLGIASEALKGIEQAVSYHEPRKQETEYRSGTEKAWFDSNTFVFHQTFLNVPVWGAGVTTTLKQAPARVVSATDTSEKGVDAKLPPQEAIERFRKLFATAEKRDPQQIPSTDPNEIGLGDSSEGLLEILGKGAKPTKAAGADDKQTTLRLIRGRFQVYRYDPLRRTEDPHTPPPPVIGVTGEQAPLVSEELPTLSLPAVSKSIQPGQWILVAEIVFRLPYKGNPMNWRALVDVETNSVVYLRALTSGVNGLVFASDPITLTGNAANGPAATAATLNALRSSVTLPGLVPPGPGANQALTGNFVRISDFEAATAPPPTEAPGADFNYPSRSNNFAAVSAYYHCDRFFRLVQSLGFPISTYFNGTTFPVPVDHRGRFGSTDGIERNASCSGDGDGIANVDYELADLGDTANPIGIAADWRVVLHELGGHGILYDHVGGPNFGFAHSAGDSFGAILNDPTTNATDRFETFPWVNFIGRRHDRSVASGWGWGGTNDVGGYSSEQILATTLFRVYRSIGGDSTDVGRRNFAARFAIYLILRAVGTLTPISNPSNAGLFLNALLTADAGNWTSEGYFGGAYGKVLTWSFEKQNLNGGARPAVDVYIEDGRAGEYQFLPAHWATTTIWNRRSPDGLATHQEPGLGVANYAYVKVKNRGTAVANNVVVKGYHCKPSAGVLWPTNLQPLTTAQLSAGTLQPNSVEERIVGPFEWTPVENAWGHDCLMMVASATGDPSNVDNFTAGEVVEDWRLVPNDNNVAQRNVTLVPGGGSVRGLMAGLHRKGFWVGNPGRIAATVAVEISLPKVLQSKGWKIEIRDLPEGTRLKANEQRLATFEVHAGAPFTKEEIQATTERDIVVTARANGEVIGGMVYAIDPELEYPYNDLSPDERKDCCREKAKELLDCLNLPGEMVKKVSVRKIAIDVELDGGSCGCD